METSDKPIRQCYWVVEGRLLAGEYPRDKDPVTSRAKIAALLKAGVRTFIDLTETHEGLLPYAQMLGDAAHFRFPIRDGSIPDSRDLSVAAIDRIDAELAAGRMVYVHCWGGVGRTGLIVGCWLAHQAGSGEAGLARLQALWQQCPKSATRPSPETAEQAQYVQHWNGLYTGSSALR